MSATVYSPFLGPDHLASLETRLQALRREMLDLETRWCDQSLHPVWSESARNFLHYLALRSHDLRGLQEELGESGLSSLGRCEAHVLCNVEAVLDLLQGVSRTGMRLESPAGLGIAAARERIDQATTALFGPPHPDRPVRIMVTISTEGAKDYSLIRNLVVGGMNTIRINCAHDDPSAWKKMIEHVRRAEVETGCTCRVMMDLAGPKIRTGTVEPGPRVLRWRPKRDSLGRVQSDARVWLACDGERPWSAPAAVRCPVDAEWLATLEPGDEIRFRDAAGRNRRLTVAAREGSGVWATSDQTTYVVPDLVLKRFQGGSKRAISETRVGSLEAKEQAIRLSEGDVLIVTGADVPGRLPVRDATGRVTSPASIGCTLPEVFSCLRVEERVLFDDGKIEGILEEVQSGRLKVRIVRTGKKGTKLKADKGINFPDSELALPALTPKDIADLEFVVQHADAVDYSFVRRVEDVRQLQAELARLGKPDFAIVLKIENRQAFEQLPKLLLAAMRSPVAGVMIARGDLAVECGFERTSEVQEEILWMCEAAHMPVIWATQVLETLAKTGLPSRAEVTDAAMGVRAECVMLNKGPHIVDAVRTLDDILRRMQEHQVKKRPMLRKLQIAQSLAGARDAPQESRAVGREGGS